MDDEFKEWEPHLMCVETTFGFGKYKYVPLIEVMEHARWYVNWCLESKTIVLTSRANHLWETGELLEPVKSKRSRRNKNK